MPYRNYKYYADARSAYYERLIFPIDFQNYSHIMDPGNYSSVYSSGLPVQFKTLAFGDNQKTVVRKLGRPRFFWENNAFSQLVIFYKETLLNHKLLVQLHFFEYAFVMATQSVIDADARWRAAVKSIIYEKYSGLPHASGPAALNPADRGDLLFKDQAGNSIFLLDSINLNVLYCSGDAAHHQHIAGFAGQKLRKITEDEDDMKAILKNSF